MLVAAVDTATLTLSCALVDLLAGEASRLRRERTERAPPAERPAGGAAPRPPAGRSGHGARLPQAIVDLLGEEGLEIPDVEAYAVGLGPGSFTGLRIGLATWKGLAYANRRPIAGASSLAALALAAAADAEDGTILVPLLDAKKKEVYAGFYRARDGGLVQLADEAALSPGELAARVRAIAGGMRAAAFGEGYEAYADVLAPALPRLETEVRTPPAAAVAALVADRLVASAYDPQALFALEPHYVRKSEAEVKFPAGLGPGARGGG